MKNTKFKITDFALQRKFTYKEATDIAIQLGKIDPSDRRAISAYSCDSEQLPIYTNRDLFSKMEDLGHTITNAMQTRGLECAEKSLCAFRRKMFDGTTSLQEDSTMLGFLASSIESSYINLTESGGALNHKSSRDVGSFIAHICDKSVLIDRHSGFDGLISPISIKTKVPMSEIAHTLWRDRKISFNDVRVGFYQYANAEIRSAKTLDFIPKIGHIMQEKIPKILASSSCESEKTVFLDDISNLRKSLNLDASTELNAALKTAAVMGKCAIILEKMALFRHEKGGDPNVTKSLLAFSNSAVERKIFYDKKIKRLREAETDTRKNSGRLIN